MQQVAAQASAVRTIGFVNHPIVAAARFIEPVSIEGMAFQTPGCYKRFLTSLRVPMVSSSTPGELNAPSSLLEQWESTFSIEAEYSCIRPWYPVAEVIVHGGWDLLGCVAVTRRPRLADYNWHESLPRRRLQAYARQCWAFAQGQSQEAAAVASVAFAGPH